MFCAHLHYAIAQVRVVAIAFRSPNVGFVVAHLMLDELLPMECTGRDDRASGHGRHKCQYHGSVLLLLRVVPFAAPVDSAPTVACCVILRLPPI